MLEQHCQCCWHVLSCIANSVHELAGLERQQHLLQLCLQLGTISSQGSQGGRDHLSMCIHVYFLCQTPAIVFATVVWCDIAILLARLLPKAFIRGHACPLSSR